MIEKVKIKSLDESSYNKKYILIGEVRLPNKSRPTCICKQHGFVYCDYSVKQTVAILPLT